MKGDRFRAPARWLMALSYVSVGISHFTQPETFVAIMPPYLPAHHELVLLSGVFEILGGIGVLVPRTRRFAGWGILALLVAVYPANIHMLVNDIYLPGMEPNRLLLWLRMPLQLGFALWAAWACEIWPPVRPVYAGTVTPRSLP